jgi:membrane-associated phospholipid phosphatase
MSLLRRARLALPVAILLSTTRAQAQTRAIGWNPPVDVTLTLSATTAYAASVALEPVLAPLRCRWCQGNALDDHARAALLWQRPELAATASDVTAFVLTPSAVFGLDAVAASHDRALKGFGVDAILIAEATMLALDVHEITKVVVARERPGVHALRWDEHRAHSPDDDISFFSGHTTAAFAMVAATGTVATMRGYRWAPVPWVVGGALATGTAYLRIAADRHWLSDVIVGMLTGVAVGIAVPLLFHPTSTPVTGAAP